MNTTSAVTPARGGALAQLRASIAVFLLLTLLTGIIYPLAITGAAQVLFPWRANGSLIDKNGRPTSDLKAAAGSELIGQDFDRPEYFWPRPSATGPVPYTSFNADKGTGSGGSNLSPAGQAFADVVKARADALRAADPGNSAPLPIDLVTASGSGLDPHESIAAATWQIERVAKARNVTPQALQTLIVAHTRGRSLGVLGEPVVNVLELNLALDRQYPVAAPSTGSMRR
ncbi:MAG TPA: potassium-transporting ATPase subunit KdpC [Phycisphaerae bacterium]|nr:potassium-transporting ATPase subunit KdpC [Phycisphaerae bacterium]